MEVIFIRSSYFIEIDEASQIGSKVEIFIWRKGDTEPATPNYTLSKKAPSTTQLKNIYNISNYVKEFITPVNPTFVSTVIEEDNTQWCYVKIKRYKEVSAGSYTLLDNVTYVALNGYTNYLDGYNNLLNDVIALTSFTDTKEYKYNSNNITEVPYFNLFIDYTDDTDDYSVVYEDLDGTIEATTSILNGDTETQYLFKIPISETISNIDGRIVRVYKRTTELFSFRFKNECEAKYEPLVCSYVNRFGGWDFITFFKARKETFEVKNKDYQLLPNDVDYNTLRGESKMFNYEAKQTIKINTGWVQEYYNELIKDLMTSETILLDNKPVKLKTMSTDLKTSLQDKMINYEIDFEYNYNQINNVI